MCRWRPGLPGAAPGGRRPLARLRRAIPAAPARSRPRAATTRPRSGGPAAAARPEPLAARGRDRSCTAREQAAHPGRGRDVGRMPLRAADRSRLERALEPNRGLPRLPRRARATCSSTSRATRSRSTTASSTCSGSSSPGWPGRTASRPSTRFWGVDDDGRGDAHRRREARLRGGDRPDDGPAGEGSGDPRLPLRAVRADGSRPPDGSPRHARGGGGPAAPRRRVRRPLPCRSAGPSRVGRELLDQEARAALRACRARWSCATRGSSIVAVRAVAGRVGVRFGAARSPQTDPTLAGIEGYNRDDCLSNWRLRDWLEDRRIELERQLGEPLPATSARANQTRVRELSDRLAARGGARREAVHEGVPWTRRRASADQHGALAARPAARAGTDARTSRSGGATSTCMNDLTDEERVDEREPIGGLEFVERRRASGRARSSTATGSPSRSTRSRSARKCATRPRAGRRAASWRSTRPRARSTSSAARRRTVPTRRRSSRSTTSTRRLCAKPAAHRRVGGRARDRGSGARTPRPGICCCGGLPRWPAASRSAGRMSLRSRRPFASRPPLDVSCLAVQGPPGSGKTYLAPNDRRSWSAGDGGWASPRTATTSSATCSTGSPGVAPTAV